MRTWTIAEWQEAIARNSEDKGWYRDANVPNPSPLWIGAQLALIGREVSEALEDVRDGRMLIEIRESDGKPIGFPTELADATSRILGVSHACGVELVDALALKHAWNLGRPYRHGGKLL